jgi:large subunit ribosomal protein L6e
MTIAGMQVDLSSVTLDEKFNDAYFKRPAAARREKSEAKFFSRKAETKNAIADNRVADQKTVDSSLLAAIKKEPMLKAYLAASFSLKKGQYPHAMKF